MHSGRLNAASGYGHLPFGPARVVQCSGHPCGLYLDFETHLFILSAAEYKFWTDPSLTSGCRRGGSRWSGASRAWSPNGKTCCRWKERTRSCPASALSTRRDTHRVAHPLFGLILHDDPTDTRILVLAETLVREEDQRPKKRTGGQTCNARFRPTRRCRSPSGVARTGPTNNKLDRLPREKFRCRPDAGAAVLGQTHVCGRSRLSKAASRSCAMGRRCGRVVSSVLRRIVSLSSVQQQNWSNKWQAQINTSTLL